MKQVWGLVQFMFWERIQNATFWLNEWALNHYVDARTWFYNNPEEV